MKGYSPTLKLNTQKELNSQFQQSFIELGVKQSKCDEVCECENCKSDKQN